jgi:replication factor A2
VQRDEQSLVAVTIKQILTAEHRDSKFKIDGKDVSQVTLVGVILTAEQQPTNITYLVDDGSGKVNVRMYVDMETDAKMLEPNQYVRVVGNIRVINSGEMSVVGFQVMPITDFNEITFHNLEALSTHLRNTKGPAGGNAGGQQGGNMQQQQQMGNNNMNNANVINANGNSGGNGGGDSVQDQVMNIFNQDNSADAGTHVDQVCQQLSSIPRADILKAIEFLSDEGHLYSTIDEEHFKSTASS